MQASRSPPWGSCSPDVGHTFVRRRRFHRSTVNCYGNWESLLIKLFLAWGGYNEISSRTSHSIPSPPLLLPPFASTGTLSAACENAGSDHATHGERTGAYLEPYLLRHTFSVPPRSVMGPFAGSTLQNRDPCSSHPWTSHNQSTAARGRRRALFWPPFGLPNCTHTAHNPVKLKF